MNLEKILSIAGKPGLYQLVAKSRNGIIVESLLNGRRIPVSQAQNISTLSKMAIFIVNGEKPLHEVFALIREREGGPAPVKHKDNDARLKAYFGEVLPDYDVDRVYASDIRKVIQWYNLLEEKGLFETEDDADAGAEDNASISTTGNEEE